MRLARAGQLSDHAFHSLTRTMGGTLLVRLRQAPCARSQVRAGHRRARMAARRRRRASGGSRYSITSSSSMGSDDGPRQRGIRKKPMGAGHRQDQVYAFAMHVARCSWQAG